MCQELIATSYSAALRARCGARRRVQPTHFDRLSTCSNSLPAKEGEIFASTGRGEGRGVWHRAGERTWVPARALVAVRDRITCQMTGVSKTTRRSSDRYTAVRFRSTPNQRNIRFPDPCGGISALRQAQTAALPREVPPLRSGSRKRVKLWACSQ